MDELERRLFQKAAGLCIGVKLSVCLFGEWIGGDARGSIGTELAKNKAKRCWELKTA